MKRWSWVGLHVSCFALFLAWSYWMPTLLLAQEQARTLPEPAYLDPTQEPSPSLDDYHFFLDAKRQVPNKRVVPYDLNTPHFADYAHLQRYLWIPNGTSIAYQKQGVLQYPVGAVLILTVSYPYDLRDSKLGKEFLETRLFVHRKQGWQGLQYLWDEETGEARLSYTGRKTQISWIHDDGTRRNHTYLAPNKNQCQQCHEQNDQIVPLGPTMADRVNRSFPYKSGSENQLQHWSRIGYLVGAPERPEDAPRMPVWDEPSSGSVDERAKAYLKMNCSSCHRLGGIAYTSGLDLTFEQESPTRYGVFKSPVAAGRGVGSGRFAIEPGHPERSFLLHRLSSTDPGIRMPIVGRGLVHEEGVDLIRQWIDQMEFAEMAAAQDRADQKTLFRVYDPKKKILRKSPITRKPNLPKEDPS